MNKVKKLLALIMAVLTAMAFIPANVSGKGRAATMSAEEKAARLDSLISFSEKLHEMKVKSASLVKRGPAGDPFATARIIVKSEKPVSDSGAIFAVSGHNDWHVIQYRTPEEARAAAERFSAMPGVEYAEPDMIMTAEAEPGSSAFLSWGYGASHIDSFDCNEWLLAHAGGNEADLPVLTVAVIDTGADTDHPYLVDRLVSGYDFIDNDPYPEDGHGHGTHVSGTVKDGTLANVKIMPIRVLGNSGEGDTTGVCLGMEYAYLHGCAVENLSLGGNCDKFDGAEHRMMEEVINAAFENGTTVCVAAGNETDDAANHCPANVARACTVAAVGENHSLAYFSNYGSGVDIAAPGVSVYSSVMGGGYGYKSGTSMACPHASAVAAMIKSCYPDINADAVVSIMKSTAKDLKGSGYPFGLVNVTGIFKYDSVLFPEGGSYHFKSEGNYPWIAENGLVKSGNAGVNSSVSSLVSRVRIGSVAKVRFEYKVSTSEGSDIFKFKCDGRVLFEASGEHDWKSVTIEMPQNSDPTLVWELAKDASGAAGSDCAWLRNIRIERTLSSAANLPGGSVALASDGEYPWYCDEDENAARSGNSGVHDSISDMTASVELQKGMKLRFNYKVDAGSGDKFIITINGRTVLNSGRTDGYKRFEYIAPAYGSYEIVFRFSKDGSGSSGSDCAWVRDLIFHHTFASAVNGSDDHLPFVNDSEFPWFAEEDYVSSMNIGVDSSESSFSLTLHMHASETLSFRYSVDSEDGYDFFRFYVNKNKQFERSGCVDWTDYSFTAPSDGLFFFEWTYAKDYDRGVGYDRAFVDDVIYSGRYEKLMGDVDGDGLVTTADALIVLRCALGITGEGALDLETADMDGDGIMTTVDALIILRMAMGVTP